MTDFTTAFAVYLGVAVSLALVTCFLCGRAHDDDPAALVLAAFFWPIFLALAVAILPFGLAYRAGKTLS